MTARPLTDRQKEILEFVEGYAGQNGFPPTLREIGEKVGIANVNAVRGHLAALEKKGYITKDPDKARSIRVIRAPSPLRRFLRKLHKIVGTDEAVFHRVVYALAWSTLNRRAILTEKVVEAMGDAFEQECMEHGWRLLEQDIRPDHVRLIVEVWPNHSAEQTVRRFKRAGAAIRLQNAKKFSGKDLWHHGYVATTDLSIFDQLIEQMMQEQ